MRKSIKKKKIEFQQSLDRLNSLASRARTVDTKIKVIVQASFDERNFILAAEEVPQPRSVPSYRWYHDSRLATFSRIEELERVLARLAEAIPMSEEDRKRAIEILEENRDDSDRKQKELMALAKRLNHPAGIMRQQDLMEEAWNLTLQDGCYYDVCRWINHFGRLPSEVGVDLMGRHNIDFVRLQDKDVSYAELHWIPGEFHHRFTRNFEETYRRYGEYPDKYFVVELRTLYTDNARNERWKILKEQIFPLLDEIRKVGFRSDSGRELIQRVQDLVAPWSVPRPWPPEKEKKKEAETKPGEHKTR